MRDRYLAWEAFIGFRNRCHDHFPKSKKRFFPDLYVRTDCQPAGHGIFSPTK
jgi:hypothetical protein